MNSTRKSRRIFQIAYTSDLLVPREMLLKRRGHDVTSVLGNEAAQEVLGSKTDYDLFIIGHAAPQGERLKIIEWLRKKYPKTKILALNPPGEQVSEADFNVQANDSEKWLSVVASM